MTEPVPIVVERSTELRQSAEEVWRRVTTVKGINYELGPWMRMTTPRGWSGASIADVDAPAHIGRSWVFLLGVIPFDYDDLGIEFIGERSFREVSTMSSASHWQHERWIESSAVSPDGCVVHDKVTFTPRLFVRAIPGGARLHRAVITATFRHRHRRLERWH
jgi:hypothetical protein